MSNKDYDARIFFGFWDTLKRTVLPGNLKGTGAGPLGSSGSASGVIPSEPFGIFVPDPDTVDVGDGSNFITLTYSTVNGYRRGPLVEISARVKGETVLERTEIPVPDSIEGESLEERTVKWIKEILVVFDSALDLARFRSRLSTYLDRFLNPYLATIGIGGPPVEVEPIWKHEL